MKLGMEGRTWSRSKMKEGRAASPKITLGATNSEEGCGLPWAWLITSITLDGVWSWMLKELSDVPLALADEVVGCWSQETVGGGSAELGHLRAGA